MLAGCGDHPTPPTAATGRALPATVKDQAQLVARFSGEADETLALFDDCTWTLGAEEAPDLGKGRYQIADAGARIILDPGWTLSPWRPGHVRSLDRADVLYDERKVEWHWEEHQPGTALPRRCHAPAP